MPEFRQDPVSARWVIIAPGRAMRPRQFIAPIAPAHGEACPFCAGNEALTPPEVWALRDPASEANTPGWSVRIVANKYPALGDHGVEIDGSNSFYRRAPALGVHEVIIESPRHVANLNELSTEQFANILCAYRARWRALAEDRRWRYLMIYKNHGDRAGATLEHVHSQMIALSEIPPQVVEELNGLNKHFTATSRCVYCDIIEHELTHGERLVAQSEYFIALCPFAPRFGFEMWLLPRKHGPAFERTADHELVALGRTLREMISKLNRLFDNAPFNYLLHSVRGDDSAAEHYHWHLELLPQLTRAAGFEWGSDLHMNSIAPEEAARLLRGATV